MPQFIVTKRGLKVAGPITAPGPGAALAHFRAVNDYEGTIGLRGDGSLASLAVLGVGLFKAERVRSVEENVADAERRAAAAEAEGDSISAESWRREARARAAGADPIRHSARRARERRQA